MKNVYKLDKEKLSHIKSLKYKKLWNFIYLFFLFLLSEILLIIIIHTMDDLLTLWKETKEMLENNLPVEKKVFLDNVNIKEQKDGEVTLVANSDFVASVIKDYRTVIENFISEKQGEAVKVKFVTDKTMSKAKPENEKETTVKKESKSKQEKKKNPTLNPKYTLDNFIQGDNSDIAYKAAKVIALNPGTTAFNPCLIYGGVGLGKTHLLQAIGNYIYDNNPSTNVVYVTAETFTNEFLESLGSNGITPNKFKKKYRDVDVFLIDDIHFLQKKAGTQEELFHTFVELHQKNKQIVFTCDRPITELTDITDRLRSRFSSGLNVDLRPPEYEVRLAIARQKNKEEKLGLDEKVLDYISQSVRTNVRDLEGALITVSGIANLIGSPATVEMAREHLKNLIVEAPAVNVDYTINDVFTATSNYFNVSLVDMRGTSRSRNIKIPRQIAMFVAYKYGHFTQSDIGKYINKDHTSVRYSVMQTESMLDSDETVRKAVDAVNKLLNKKNV